MKNTILAGLLLLGLTGCATTNSPPKHTQTKGQTTATYLQADYGVSYEVQKNDETMHITLSCSSGSSLKLFNMQLHENPIHMRLFVLVTTTHPTSVGKFYYNDWVPVTGKFVPSHSALGKNRLFASEQLYIYADGDVTLDDKFKAQLETLNDAK